MTREQAIEEVFRHYDGKIPRRAIEAAYDDLRISSRAGGTPLTPQTLATQAITYHIAAQIEECREPLIARLQHAWSGLRSPSYEELIQEVHLLALKQPQSFRDAALRSREQLCAYVWGILKNKSSETWRRQRREPTLSPDEIPPDRSLDIEPECWLDQRMYGRLVDGLRVAVLERTRAPWVRAALFAYIDRDFGPSWTALEREFEIDRTQLYRAWSRVEETFLRGAFSELPVVAARAVERVSGPFGPSARRTARAWLLKPNADLAELSSAAGCRASEVRLCLWRTLNAVWTAGERAA